jgi:colicin import membrane protein
MSVERRASGSSRDMVTAPKTRLVQKQPHLLAYITPAEAALLKKNGGTGEMVNGIPAFPRGSVSKAKVDKAKAKTSTKSAPAPRNDRQPVAKSTPAPAPRDRDDRPPVTRPAPPPPPRDTGPSAAEKAAAAAKAASDAKAAADRRAKAEAEAKAAADG